MKEENKIAFFPAESGWTLQDVIKEENLMRRTLVDNVVGTEFMFNTTYGHGDGINSRPVGRAMSLTITNKDYSMHALFTSKKRLEKFRDIINEYLERYEDRFLDE